MSLEASHKVMGGVNKHKIQQPARKKYGYDQPINQIDCIPSDYCLEESKEDLVVSPHIVIVLDNKSFNGMASQTEQGHLDGMVD